MVIHVSLIMMAMNGEQFFACSAISLKYMCIGSHWHAHGKGNWSALSLNRITWGSCWKFFLLDLVTVLGVAHLDFQRHFAPHGPQTKAIVELLSTWFGSNTRELLEALSTGISDHLYIGEHIGSAHSNSRSHSTCELFMGYRCFTRGLKNRWWKRKCSMSRLDNSTWEFQQVFSIWLSDRLCTRERVGNGAFQLPMSFQIQAICVVSSVCSWTRTGGRSWNFLHID